MADVTIAKTKVNKTEHLLNVTLVGFSYARWLLHLAEVAFANIIYKHKWNLFALFDTKKPTLCALFLFHDFMKNEKLTIHLVFFTIPESYYNDFFVITKMSVL